MVTKAFEGTDVGVEQNMFTGEKSTVVIEGKGKVNQADLWAHGKLQELRKQVQEEQAPKVLSGDLSVATGPDQDKEYQFKYKVMELDDIIPSHTTAMAPNPKYTSELQPRVRDRAASRLQVEKIARGLKPKALLTDIEQLDQGPMIIGPDHMVESGNGRAIALKIASQEYPENFAEYRAGLIHRAKKYGFDPDSVAKMKQPVLVRERKTKVDRKNFVAECNQIAVMAMSPYEQALQDAKNIRSNTLAGLTVSENQSIDQALLSAANRPLARQFADSVPNNERAAILDDKGNLNQAGLQRLKAALFAKTYPGDAGEDPELPAAPPVVSKVGGPMEVKFSGPKKAAYPAPKPTDLRVTKKPQIPDTIENREKLFNAPGAQWISGYEISNRLSPKDAVKRSKQKAKLTLKGQYSPRDPLEVWEVTRPDGSIFYSLRDGNTTFQMLYEQGWKEFPVTVTKKVPLSELTAAPKHTRKSVGPVKPTPQQATVAPKSDQPVKVSTDKPKKNGRWPRKAVSQDDIDRVQANRTERARKLDSMRSSQNIRTRDNAAPWERHPDRYDLEGVDTPGKRSPVHSGLLKITSKKGTIIKRGRARGKATKSKTVVGMKVIRRRR